MTLYTTYTYINSELLYQWNHIKTHKTISEFEQFLFWTILNNENSDPKQILIIFWTNENTKHAKYTVFYNIVFFF